MAGSHKPSIKRISEITGYSTATVSNALNMKRGVNKETSERIFQVAEELGYSVGPRGLKSIKFVIFRRNGSIIDDSPFHPAVMNGVEAAAKENGLATIYVRLNYGESDYEEQLNALLSDANGGIILLGTEMLEEDFVPFRKCKCPLILLDGWSDKNAFDGVLINNLDSAVCAVNYLIGKGHRRIGYIRGSYRIKAFQSRERGYETALREGGIARNPDWTVTVGTKTELAYKDMIAWLEKNPSLPSAFFVDNDLIAYGVIRALTQKGVHVPKDVSIVGFDDLPYSAVSSPALTTIHVNGSTMGREAVNRLLDMMDSPGTGQFKIEGCTEFVERESVCEIASGG